MPLIPTSLFGVAVLITLVVPGIVYAAVRTSLQGFVGHDGKAASRVIQAVMVSVLLDSVYAIVFGVFFPDFLSEGLGLATRTLWKDGLVVLVCGICIPALAAYVIYGEAPWIIRLKTTSVPAWLSRCAEPFMPNTGYRRSPTAWDWIAPKQADVWIRVLSAQGRWVGGWATEDTFFSSYPEAKDLYIPQQWVLDDTGAFVNISENTAGVWLPLEGAQLVEWIRDRPEIAPVIEGSSDA